MAFDTQVTTVTIGDLGSDNLQKRLLKAPSAGNGGGITIMAVDVVSATTLAKSAGVGGTTPTLILHRYSAAGTPAVNGTVSSNTVGGTAVGWTAGVPQAFTLNNAYCYLSPGESLVAQYNEVNAGNFIDATVTIHWQRGK